VSVLVRSLALMLILAAMLLPSVASSADVVVVRSEGTSTRTKDAGEAKSIAVDMALRGAVREAAQRLADYDPGVDDVSGFADDITADPLAFVKNYRILSEGWVSVQAADGDLPPEGAGVPGTEEGFEEGPEPAPAPDWGADEGPGAVTSWADDPWAEPEEVYHISIEASVDATLLREAISRLSAPEGGATESMIKVVLMDAYDYTTYSRFRDALEAIPMVKELSYDSFYRGRIVFHVRSTGSTLVLKQRVANVAGPGFDVLFGGRGMITAKVVQGSSGHGGGGEVEWR